MYQEVCFNRGTEVRGGGVNAGHSLSPPSHFMLATGLHSNDVDDCMGAKIKTPKNPWTKNSPPPPPPQKKIPYRTTRPKYASTTTNLYLYQAAQDNTCPIFLLQKLPESKISNPKNPSIIAVT